MADDRDIGKIENLLHFYHASTDHHEIWQTDAERVFQHNRPLKTANLKFRDGGRRPSLEVWSRPPLATSWVGNFQLHRHDSV